MDPQGDRHRELIELIIIIGSYYGMAILKLE